MSRVGSEVDGYCGRCRAVTDHKVLSEVGGEPARVRCECGAEHKHRVGVPTEGKQVRFKKVPPVLTVVPRPPTVASRVEGKVRVAYDPDRRFAPGEVMDHRAFGVGIVGEAVGPQKVRVEFEGGVKVIVHDRSAVVAPELVRHAR